MENEKKVYETPEVTKVEFDASDRITASGCDWLADHSHVDLCDFD